VVISHALDLYVVFLSIMIEIDVERVALRISTPFDVYVWTALAHSQGFCLESLKTSNRCKDCDENARDI